MVPLPCPQVCQQTFLEHDTQTHSKGNIMKNHNMVPRMTLVQRMLAVILSLPLLFSLLPTSIAQAALPDYCSPASNIILVMDTSRSMEGQPWEDAKTAVKNILERHPSAHYGMVYFSTGANLAVPLIENNEPDIIRSLDQTWPVGWTNIQGGLQIARDELQSKLDRSPFKELQSIIILITDGVPNRGTCRTAECLRDQAASMLNPGLNVDGTIHKVMTFVIGFREGIDANILNAIAEGGGTGQYTQANSLNELQNALEAMMTSVPSDEICDGYDNNCDGVIDDGLNPNPSNLYHGDICQTGMPGECALGYRWCQNGTWACMPLNLPQPETCNGRDSDCDGFIDGTDTNGNMILEPGESLRNACGTCDSVPVEICNGTDDDCDGVVDNGATCPVAGESCVNGQCVNPCASGECPSGLVCQNGWCVEACSLVSCPAGHLCDPDMGDCYNPCEGIDCGNLGECIMGRCGSCRDLGCNSDSICVYPGNCVENTCLATQCRQESQCTVLEDGGAQCAASCATISCEAGFSCVGGECLINPCTGITCPESKTCLDGTCVVNLCTQDPSIKESCEADSKLCTMVWDNQAENTTAMAACVTDPCERTICPESNKCQSVCISGECSSRCVYKDAPDQPINPWDDLDLEDEDTGVTPGDSDVGADNGDGDAGEEDDDVGPTDPDGDAGVDEDASQTDGSINESDGGDLDRPDLGQEGGGCACSAIAGSGNSSGSGNGSPFAGGGGGGTAALITVLLTCLGLCRWTATSRRNRCRSITS